MITEEMRKAIGTEKVTSIEIERRTIKRFVEATEDPNPLWQECAPPMLFSAVMMSGKEARPEVPNPLPRILDGGGKWEFFQPVRPGDVITNIAKLADIREREGKLGKMLYWRFEMTHKNQRGEIVAKSTSTVISY